MKSTFLAIIALIGHASAVQLNKESMYDPEYYAGLYKNILIATDPMEQAQTDNQTLATNEAATTGANVVKSKDAYDFDPTSVSPYDAETQNQPMSNEQRKDWFEKVNEHKKSTFKIFDAQIGSTANLAQKK